ncbi:MAG: TonB family protein [Candidatus Competibacteraceae bacterium]
MDSTTLLSQVAGLEMESQQKATAGVRTKRVNLTDTRSAAGFYVADWARKVTRVGEMNFPDAARRLNISTGPFLEVAIRADGHLQEVRILRSSGNPELDQAAQRIVRQAAPYPPFSPELRQQYDLLRIEAPWRFDPGGQLQIR